MCIKSEKKSYGMIGGEPGSGRDGRWAQGGPASARPTGRRVQTDPLSLSSFGGRIAKRNSPAASPGTSPAR